MEATLLPAIATEAQTSLVTTKLCKSEGSVWEVGKMRVGMAIQKSQQAKLGSCVSSRDYAGYGC